MHCTDDGRRGAGDPGRRRVPGARRPWLIALALVLAGCATRAPAPGRPDAPAETPAPARTGAVSLPAPAAARTWDEFSRNAGQRLVAALPSATYTGPVPDVLLAIPVIETELYVDGTIKSIRVVREPNDTRTRDTVQLAIAAIRAAAPYGDMSRLSRPWTWVEVFLFNDQRQFKPRALD